MELTAKYCLGEDLWVMDIPKPRKFVPYSCMKTMSPSGIIQILYSEQWKGEKWTSEEFIFRTREELINSL